MSQINAREWIFEVTDDLTGTPVWAEVGGLESFTISNSAGEASTETTTFASDGQAESQAMQRGATLGVNGKLTRDDAGVDDAGQAMADGLAAEVGNASLGGVRFRHLDETDWTVWTAWASKGDTAGGNNDKASWSATFTRSGAASVVTVV